MNNQVYMVALKENLKSPENEFKDMEICNLSDREFTIAVL